MKNADPQAKTQEIGHFGKRISLELAGSLRPVCHQKTERVEAHVPVRFLTLAIWRILEMWMKGKGLGNRCRQPSQLSNLG